MNLLSFRANDPPGKEHGKYLPEDISNISDSSASIEGTNKSSATAVTMYIRQLNTPLKCTLYLHTIINRVKLTKLKQDKVI